jgi:hypothetical protein
LKLKELKELLIQIGMDDIDAQKQCAMLVLLINHRITGKEIDEAKDIINEIMNNYYEKISSSLPLSKKLYFREKFNQFLI